MADLRHPIGPFTRPELPLTPGARAAALRTLSEFPARMRLACAGLSEAQLDTPYRPGGWTVRQVVHHTADSHLNAYIRMKFAMTEDHPAVKPYAEGDWAELADARSAPVALSLDLLDALHARLVLALKALPPEGFARTLFHPEHGSTTVDYYVALYDWHCRHHTAHVTALREREGW